MAATGLVYPLTPASVDLESLLWEMRDLLRGLSQVSKAQSTEIERLGGHAVSIALAHEFGERTDAALAACDVVLDNWDDADGSDASTQFEAVNIAAWVKATNKSLGFDDDDASDNNDAPVSPAQDPVDVVLPTPVVPNNFWEVHEFKWEDEPLDGSNKDSKNQDAAQAPSAQLHQASAHYHQYRPHAHPDVDANTPMHVADGRGLVPDEHIPELWLDDSFSDASSSTPRGFDDGATLYHPDEPTSPTRRFSLADPRSFFNASAPASPDADALFFTPTTTTAPSSTARPALLKRTNSAPDLRLLRGPAAVITTPFQLAPV
ncbi:hypothetical protein AURDEDRAFT_154619 [Auricularia subglabra TFB-10046 SS5]|uniref:Uncharacterized protein n=1 Tax=Auricularia subglabra (strain TFB-10046 / SS5) TaxID=717982 RepID=J0WT32_AURST|nr:hypothetical protein AURDEDRAFT_154619 [Auricularia subglabra TFB-10046 SS5]